jgi:hypothetical protein
MTICVCGEETKNPRFCSRSCSAKETNKIPKRKKVPCFCKVCGIEIPSRNQYCNDHNKNIVDWSLITYGEIIGKRAYQVNSRIRNLCRSRYKQHIDSCEKCGYDKHVEIHHIKEISSYQKDALISEINSRDNLKFLCPNCHWEEHNMSV